MNGGHKMNTRENDDIRQTLRQAMCDDLPPAVAEQMQSRIAAFRQRCDTAPPRPRNRISQWIGGFSMRQRIAALGSVGVAAILGFVLLWGGSAAQQASAMEKMAENIRKAKSYTCQVTVRDKAGSVPPRPDLKATAYWIAPGSARVEMTYPEWQGPGPEQVDIYPLGKPGIHIFHPNKTFSQIPARQKEPLSTGTDDIESLGKFSGKADRQLGTKAINGKNAQGFIIDIHKVHPKSPPGTIEVWLDAETNLPLFIRSEVQLSPGRTVTEERSDIQWNIDLDRRLFDPTPPRGYTDTTPKPLAVEEQVRRISEALRIYAKASGGHYPVKSDAQYVIDDVCKMLGVTRWGQRNRGDKNGARVAKVTAGMSQISKISVYKPEFAYYGKIVGPKDKDKVLLRWKLDDGRYEVIFGDLRAETVTAERLWALEGKSSVEARQPKNTDFH
jgi:outer membrane lipoprotein-sorting protein